MSYMEKTRAFRDLKYDTAILNLANLLVEAKRKRPSKRLDEMEKALMAIIFHVNDLRMEREMFDELMGEKVKQLHHMNEELKEAKNKLKKYDFTFEQ